MTATDDSKDSLSYMLTGRDSAFFEVDQLTGQVRVARSLTFLKPGRYLVALHALNPQEGIASIALTIIVQAVQYACLCGGRVHNAPGAGELASGALL